MPAQPRLFPAVILAAVLATLSFPPAGFGLLAWLALIPLIGALERAGGRWRAFALGYLFGLLHWGALTPWIGVTVVRWAGTPLGWLAWVGLTLIESGWFALVGALVWLVCRRTGGTVRAASVAAAWTLVEWLKTQGGLAMPWGLLGYTQQPYLPLIQAADLGGVLFVSFTIVFANASLAEWWARRGMAGAYRPVLIAGAWVLAVTVYGVWRLHGGFPGLAHPVIAMQPNVTSERAEPRDPAQELATLTSMAAGVPRPERRRDVEAGLIVWPESAAPVDAITEQQDHDTFSAIARSTGAWQVVGSPFRDENGRPHNSAVLFAPDGIVTGRYDKQWLVPYGEWMPGRSWMPFGSVFHFVPHDVVPGTSDDPLPAGRARISPLICYESVFPQLARRRAAQGANLLISITNDSWAGRSGELGQHLQMTAVRAVETRRWIVAAATTGVSALISPEGRVTSLPAYAQGVLRGEAGLRDERTLYVRWGDWFVLACALWLLGTTSVGGRSGRDRAEAPSALPARAGG